VWGFSPAGFVQAWRITVADEITILKDRLLDAIRREGFTVFYGAFPTENLPQLAWNSDLESDPDRFFQVVKAQNLRVVYLNWVPFTAETIDQNVLRVEEGHHLSAAQTDWLNDHNNRIEEFREYAGQTASVRVGFLLDGVFHFYERVYDWYDAFGALVEEEMPEA
jgi:hypothetical protein